MYNGTYCDFDKSEEIALSLGTLKVSDIASEYCEGYIKAGLDGMRHEMSSYLTKQSRRWASEKAAMITGGKVAPDGTGEVETMLGRTSTRNLRCCKEKLGLKLLIIGFKLLIIGLKHFFGPAKYFAFLSLATINLVFFIVQENEIALKTVPKMMVFLCKNDCVVWHST
jgi:hypothetical protein